MKNTNKTIATQTPVDAYITTLSPSGQEDARKLIQIMQLVTHEKPVMWGSSMVGFGSYHYHYESGREGDFFKVGFSIRKTAISLYLMGIMYQFEHDPEVAKLFSQLGKFKTGKGCVYVKILSDIDIEVLKKLIKIAYTRTNSTPKQSSTD